MVKHGATNAPTNFRNGSYPHSAAHATRLVSTVEHEDSHLRDAERSYAIYTTSLSETSAFVDASIAVCISAEIHVVKHYDVYLIHLDSTV